MQRVLILLLLLLQACGGGGSGGSVNLPPQPEPEPETPVPVTVGLEPAFPETTFEAPMAMLQPPGDDAIWFVVERAGRVWRFDTADRLASRVIDISTQVSTAGEGGLLGMAFHPDFASNGRAYLSYTAPGLESRISEFLSTAGGGTLAADTERLLLTVAQDANNHNGGHIAFGPDGYLYLGLGDGGGANDPLGRAQDTTNVLGAVLRIDVDNGQPYGIPADNPGAGNALCLQGFGGAQCPEIFAWGLRNPWRFSFDRESGELWLGDVGQGDREEIDLIEPAGNYGWPTREGSICNPNLFEPDCVTVGFIDPVVDYTHDLGRSVTGGYVYRGSDIPGLVGQYLFGDFISGRIWRLVDDGSGVEKDELLDTELRIVSFAEGNDGELYVLDISGGIFRLVNAAP